MIRINKLEKSYTDNKCIDLIDIIQNQVIDIVKEEYPDCYNNDLDVWVSRLFDISKENEIIILTMKHMGHCYSRYLYPQEDSFYGLDSLYKIITSLYNQTM